MAVAVEFSTIPEMFFNLTGKFSSETRPVLMHKAAGSFVGISYAELRRKVTLFAFGLASMGIRKGDRVSIVSENRPEWVISDLAIASLGAVNVPIYPTLTARQNEFIFNDAGVRIAIVSNQFQLNKVLKVVHEVGTLEKIIVMTEKGNSMDPKAIGFSKVYEMGEAFERENPDHLTASLAMIRPEDLLTLIYTSGTTGNPKGVMLTHHNLVTNMISAAQVIPFQVGEVLLSFLPLCHSFERMAGYYTAMACGATIAYAESIEKVQENMMEVRPTIITTVPRLFERMHGKILKKVDSSPPLRRKIFGWGLGVGREHAMARKRGSVPVSLAVQRALAGLLVFSKLKARTGGRIKFFVSGGAALAREFGEFFEAAGIKIIEGYGLTETSPVISVNRLDNYKWGSVGLPIPGVEVKIDVDGEILSRGPNTMKGYWNNPEATAEMIDKEGWLHTGDVGVMDSEGFIYITDRKKHLFVSSGGKNIAPQPIESLFLSSKYIEQFVLIGDRRSFLTALIVPDFEALKEHADSHKIVYSANADLAAHPEINQLIDKDIARLQKDLASFERIRRFTLLDRSFTIEDGELTPTQKVRRKVVEQKYAHLIEGMYRGLE